MPKINSYEIVDTPLLTDKLIGTDVGGTPANQTKNFTVEQLGNTIGWHNTTTTITPAQMLNANTPIELIPAPGTGKTLQILEVVVCMPFNSVAYNAPADFKIRMGGEVFYTWTNSAFYGININVVSNSYVIVLKPEYVTTLGGVSVQLLATGSNIGPSYSGANNLELIAAGLPPTQGDSTVYIKTTHRTLNVGSTI